MFGVGGEEDVSSLVINSSAWIASVENKDGVRGGMDYGYGEPE